MGLTSHRRRYIRPYVSRWLILSAACCFLCMVCLLVLIRMTPAAENRVIALTFRPYEASVPQAVTPVASADSLMFLSETPIATGKMILFKKQNDTEPWVYAGFQSEGDPVLYDVGPVSYGDLASSPVDVTSSGALGKSTIRLTGACGANCPLTRYLTVEHHIPSVWLNLEAHAVETDLDGDGVAELVTSVGTLAETSILRMEQGQLLVASLNRELDAMAVTFMPETQVFAVDYLSREKKPEIFRYENGRLRYIRNYLM